MPRAAEINPSAGISPDAFTEILYSEVPAAPVQVHYYCVTSDKNWECSAEEFRKTPSPFGGVPWNPAELLRGAPPGDDVCHQALEEAADIAKRNRFPRLELLALGELQRLVLAPEGKEAEGMARLEATARSMNGQPLSAFASVRNW